MFESTGTSSTCSRFDLAVGNSPFSTSQMPASPFVGCGFCSVSSALDLKSGAVYPFASSEAPRFGQMDFSRQNSIPVDNPPVWRLTCRDHPRFLRGNSPQVKCRHLENRPGVCPSCADRLTGRGALVARSSLETGDGALGILLSANFCRSEHIRRFRKTRSTARLSSRSSDL